MEVLLYGSQSLLIWTPNNGLYPLSENVSALKMFTQLSLLVVEVEVINSFGPGNLAEVIGLRKVIIKLKKTKNKKSS